MVVVHLTDQVVVPVIDESVRRASFAANRKTEVNLVGLFALLSELSRGIDALRR